MRALFSCSAAMFRYEIAPLTAKNSSTTTSPTLVQMSTREPSCEAEAGLGRIIGVLNSSEAAPA